MKKFLKEFKEFALQGDVLSMAIGVIIGAAFKDLVTSFTDSFITPLLNMIGGVHFGGRIPLPGPDGNAITWGAFLSAVVNFLIMALILFVIVQAANKLMSIGKKKDETAPLTRKCPYCRQEIDIHAVKCPYCTSDVKDVKDPE